MRREHCACCTVCARISTSGRVLPDELLLIGLDHYEHEEELTEHEASDLGFF